MRPLTDSTALLGDPTGLRRQLDEDGYLFLAALVPAGDVLEVRREFTDRLCSLGWLEEGTEPLDAVAGPRATREQANPDPEFFVGYELLQRTQSFHELAHHPAILGAVAAVVDDEVLVHPRKIARAGLPKDFEFMTPPHQDYRLIQGTGDVLTLWMPLGDCPSELGGLAVLSGSHRRGLLPALSGVGAGSMRIDVDEEEPGWRGCDMKAGDVLIFHSLTVHMAKPNYTDSLRLSVDFRYQSVHEPVVAGSLSTHYMPVLPDWDEITEGWSSRWSVETPEGVTVVDVHDAFDPEMATPPSKLVTLPS